MEMKKYILAAFIHSHATSLCPDTEKVTFLESFISDPTIGTSERTTLFVETNLL